jgi:hypothetical protein
MLVIREKAFLHAVSFLEASGVAWASVGNGLLVL